MVGGAAVPCAMSATRPDTSTIIESFLAAVAARDLDAILEHFAAEAVWRNMPHAPAEGHAGIRAMLAPILGRSTDVRWDVVTASYGEQRAWVERVDRFWIDGTEYAVECHGVIDIDPATGLITSLRDYVDLGEWRARLAAVTL
jgi:limonene-1,2-epoxide hydrolase